MARIVKREMNNDPAGSPNFTGQTERHQEVQGRADGAEHQQGQSRPRDGRAEGQPEAGSLRSGPDLLKTFIHSRALLRSQIVKPASLFRALGGRTSREVPSSSSAEVEWQNVFKELLQVQLAAI